VEESGDEGSDDSDDMPDDLNLAWEVLDLGRLALEDPKNTEAAVFKYKLLLSDIYMALGNVAIESDNLEGAVQEFGKCMDVRKAAVEPNDRLLAEGHYFIGLALCMIPEKISEAKANFDAAKAILNDNLVRAKSSEERAELEDIIKDVDARIEEVSGPLPGDDLLKDSPFGDSNAASARFPSPFGNQPGFNAFAAANAAAGARPSPFAAPSLGAPIQNLGIVGQGAGPVPLSTGLQIKRKANNDNASNGAEPPQKKAKPEEKQ